ncbi:MAG: hypothetical protein KatS3mg094_538 [Candidatus Parcubacteria bacterium]|nr:MAG: hypothetical protein KatS3mg094_538 [Candidatus Parcubacteria bacterium]
MKELLYETLDDLISNLDLRQKDIFKKRFGLDDKQYTLAELGRNYNLTRERIRQIQSNILKNIHEKIYSHNFLQKDFLYHLNKYLGNLKIKRLEYIKLKFKENYNFDLGELKILELFLRIHPQVYLFEENEIYNNFIYLQEEYFRNLNNFTKHIINFFDKEKVISEIEFLEFLKGEIFNHFKIETGIDEIYEFIRLFKIIRKNPFNEFGYIKNKRILPSSLIDKIRLILSFEKRPLSFYEIYKKLNEINKIDDEFIHQVWKKKYSLRTVHYILNSYKKEFVLVGRGVYTLKDCGIKEGKLIDIITELVKENNGLSLDDLLDNLKKQQRIFSKNTFLIYVYRNFRVINGRVYLR